MNNFKGRITIRFRGGSLLLLSFDGGISTECPPGLLFPGGPGACISRSIPYCLCGISAAGITAISRKYKDAIAKKRKYFFGK